MAQIVRGTRAQAQLAIEEADVIVFMVDGKQAGDRVLVYDAEGTILDAVTTVLLDVNEKYRQLRQSRTQLRVARLAQETAIESLRVSRNKYAVQNVLLKDVLQGQVNLEQSNSEYQQALLSFWNARADFERALGEDL